MVRLAVLATPLTLLTGCLFTLFDPPNGGCGAGQTLGLEILADFLLALSFMFRW